MLRLFCLCLFIFPLSANSLGLKEFFPDTLTGRYRPPNPQVYGLILKSNIFPLLWGSVPLTAEYRLIQEITIARRQSSLLGFSYLGKGIVLKVLENTLNAQHTPFSIRLVVSGYRLQAAHKFYISRLRMAPQGWYLSPHISYSTSKFSTTYGSTHDHYIRGTHFNINFLVGRQRIERRFVTDYFFGLGYKRNSWHEHHPNSWILPMNINQGEYYNSPLHILIGFNMGYAFR